MSCVNSCVPRRNKLVDYSWQGWLLLLRPNVCVSCPSTTVDAERNEQEPEGDGGRDDHGQPGRRAGYGQFGGCRGDLGAGSCSYHVTSLPSRSTR